MNIRKTWISAGAAALVAAALTTAFTWPATVEALPAPTPTASVTVPTDRESDDARWQAINDALAANDRAAFLAHATGQAETALARWWDGTRALGWTEALMTPWDEETVYLGAQFAYAPAPPRGNGSDDAGLSFLQGSYYSVTWEGDLLATLTPYAQPKPWDEGEVHAASGKNVIVYGPAAEAALIDATLPDAERAAAAALEQVASFGAKAPVSGFLVAVTDDAQAFARWQFGDDAPWDMRVAGFALPTYRPPGAEPWIAPDVALGDAASGTLTAVGPLSADTRLDTLTHEFMHVLHQAATEQSLASAPLATSEGFANWATARALGEPAGFDPYPVREAIRTEGIGAFSDDALRGDEAWIGYAAAESFYAFVVASGGDAWALAVASENNAEALPAAAARQNPAFTVAAWQEWVAAY